MFSNVRHLILSVKNDPGYIFQAIANRYSMRSSLENLRSQYEFKTIIDVGANVGDFSRTCRNIFTHSTIHAFEPLLECVEEMRKNFLNDELVKIHNYAIGSQVGSIEFFKNDHLDSSSLLKTSEQHNQIFNFASNYSKQIVQVTTLDEHFKNKKIDTTLLKLDIQGYEHKELLGAKKTLRTVAVVICEVNFVKLYEDQSYFRDIFTITDSNRLSFSGMINIVKNPKTSQIISGDALFLKA